MERETALYVLQCIVEQNHVAVQSVIDEINDAIMDALQKADPQIRKQWENVPCEGERPDALELLIFLANEYNNCLKNKKAH